MSNISIKDESGKLLMADEEQNNRWVEYFLHILKQRRTALKMKGNWRNQQLEVKTGDVNIEVKEIDIEDLPNRKAPGPDTIPTELLKAGGRTMAEHDCSTIAGDKRSYRKNGEKR
ncbi:hypothetical protein ANCDUO_06926 [Ancylostoma duodenale]|uniref:Uncharacterized protein n=1 Tax=Ancylostoma duodenale TaxID=51022 RepID=A0A0C2D0D1_9BILA|nr:hypothetical protein ANCDUO_06926 [Ancylostoma duodenale]